MKTCEKVKNKRENESRVIFRHFYSEKKKTRKANQKPRNESTGTIARLGRDIDPVSKKSHSKVIIVFAAITFRLNDGKRLRVRREV